MSIPDEEFETCDGPYAGDGEGWTVGNSTGGDQNYNLYTGTQQSVNTFFAQLEAETGHVRADRARREDGHQARPTDASRCRPGSSASPTPTR